MVSRTSELNFLSAKLAGKTLKIFHAIALRFGKWVIREMSSVAEQNGRQHQAHVSTGNEHFDGYLFLLSYEFKQAPQKAYYENHTYEFVKPTVRSPMPTHLKANDQRCRDSKQHIDYMELGLGNILFLSGH
jgi:hypothetical protein